MTCATSSISTGHLPYRGKSSAPDCGGIKLEFFGNGQKASHSDGLTRVGGTLNTLDLSNVKNEARNCLSVSRDLLAEGGDA